jgi:hypothetical protein
MGGKCKAGLCQPYALKDFGKSQWCNLAQDSTHLFAVTQTSLTNCKLVMVPKQGGASIYLASLTDVAAPGDL